MRFVIELECTQDEVRGSVNAQEREEARSFSGWLELFALLESFDPDHEAGRA